MRARVAVLLAVALVATPVVASASDAIDDVSAAGTLVSGTPTAVVVWRGDGEQVGSWSASRGGGGARWDCRYRDLTAAGGAGFELGYDPMSTPVLASGRSYLLRCTDADGATVYEDLITWDPADPLGALVADERAAQQALAGIDLPAPVIVTSPPVGVDHLVGLATWFAGPVGPPLQATATIGATSSTVTATPVHTAWDSGDGGSVECPAGVSSEPHPGCAHVYERGSADQPEGTFLVTATTTWEVTWTSTAGGSGDLGALTTTASVPVRVVEVQAVVGS